jgi:RnfABCDGE-type electron transport complex D subunit/RnfABCDGE-type electron transport complex G subunit
MYDVILTLIPATVVGIYHHGFHAFMVIAMSIATALLTEYVFDYIAGKPNTLKDGSAVVTGLLLALCLPASVPLYIPFVGSLFAILFVKCFFGGLGHNFMNPALAGRCFLLISFSGTMTNYTYDGITTATPLVDLASGQAVNVGQILSGASSGVIGNSTVILFIGGMCLWLMGGITFEIPTALIVSFLAFIALFGGHGLDPMFLLAHLAGGGVIMAAFFMATDPVSSPVTSRGQILYGALAGILCGLFRVYGNAADSVSYAIIISNMVVPLIDEICVPVPYGNREQKSSGSGNSAVSGSKGIPKSALILCAITLVAGVALSGVYALTKSSIEEQQMAANAASYAEVCPDATNFSYDDTISAAVDALGGEVYGTDFGKAYINEAVIGTDASGNVVGYVISATSGDGFEGNITLAVGIAADGTVNGISFTELNETAGMGMLCGEDAFKGQFTGVNTDKFTLNKAGGSTADNEIDSVSGASTSSGAVVNAVNAALDFYAANMK